MTTGKILFILLFIPLVWRLEPVRDLTPDETVMDHLCFSNLCLVAGDTRPWIGSSFHWWKRSGHHDNLHEHLTEHYHPEYNTEDYLDEAAAIRSMRSSDFQPFQFTETCSTNHDHQNDDHSACQHQHE